MMRSFLAACVASLTLSGASVRAEETRPRVAVAVHASGQAKRSLESALRRQTELPVDVRLVELPAALQEDRSEDTDLRARIASARESYVEADFEGCLSALPDETALVSALGRGDVTSAARTLVFRAACEAARGSLTEARLSAERFAILGLELPADIGAVAPDVERLFTDSLQRARSEKRLPFTVDSTPHALEVLLDGAPRGCLTPCTLEVVAGEHVAAVRGDGVAPRSERVRVAHANEHVVIATTRATPELAAAQWRARYGAGGNVESTESLVLLAEAVRAPRLALLSLPNTKGASELRGAYSVDGNVVARSGAEGVSAHDLDDAGISVLEDLLIRGKTLEPAPPIYKNIWFWSAVSLVAASAVTVTALVLHEPEQQAELRFDAP